MEHTMFCFQCEQTAGCTGCTGRAGVCGKSAGTAKLQDELTGALIGLARATDNAPGVNEDTWQLLIEGLFTTVTNVNFHDETIRAMISRVHAENRGSCRAARPVLPPAGAPATMTWPSSGTRRRISAV